MKLLYILLAFILVLHPAFSQKKKGCQVPDKVAVAFKARYPDAKKVKWEMEEGGYEASFKNHDKAMSANFTADGTRYQVETEIKTNELPEAVRASLAREFSGYRITGANRHESQKFGSCYEADLENGKREIDVILTGDGTVLQVLEEKNESHEE